MKITTIDDISESIEKAKGGDSGAFTQIVRRYQSLVSGVLFSATGDFHKSEDLAQETFLIAWSRLGELKNNDDLAAWLCTIARNLAHRSYRKWQERPSELVEEKESLQPGPVCETMRREQSELVWSSIGTIEEPYRETLVLFYRSNQSVREIAAATNSTEDAVKQRLVRARKSLKVKLEQMIGDVLTETAPGDVFTLSVMTAIGASLLTTTAQAAVVTTTGTAATGGGVAGSKALGAATIWTVLAPVAFAAWFLSMFIGFFWAAIRNAPTLRARRYRVYSIFWCLQFYAVFCIVVGVGGSTIFTATSKIFQFHPAGGSILVFIMTFIPLMLFFLPLQAAYYRKFKRIVENDLGLPGPSVDSYSYSQVERRFFLSLITNILAFETVLGFLVCVTWTDASGNDPKFLLGVLIAIGVAALLGTIYSLLGRYFLEIVRTKENFLATPPLLDHPLEAALLKPGVSPVSVDHPTRAGFMFGPLLLTWIGSAGFGVWYFSLYSWDQHPIALGICAVLMFGVFGVQTIFARKADNQQNVFLVSAIFFVFLPIMVIALEYIEFGGLSPLWDYVRNPAIRKPGGMIHNMNFMWLLMSGFFFLIQFVKWGKAKREADAEKESGRETLIREAIAQFKPEELIDDKPIIESKPFPKRWVWVLGIYGVTIVVLWCLGVLIPNPFVSMRTLERNNDFTALIEREPNNPKWYLMRGNKMASSSGGENFEKALEDFDLALRLKPDYAEVLNARAGIRSQMLIGLKQGEVEFETLQRQALADIDRAIRLEPKNWKFYSQRASIHTGNNNLDAAEADYTEAIRLEPTSWTYWARGNFFDYWRKDTSKALGDFTLAIQLAEKEKAKTSYPEYPLEWLYRERGKLYEKLGEPEKAKIDYEKSK